MVAAALLLALGACATAADFAKGYDDYRMTPTPRVIDGKVAIVIVRIGPKKPMPEEFVEYLAPSEYPIRRIVEKEFSSLFTQPVLKPDGTEQLVLRVNYLGLNEDFRFQASVEVIDPVTQASLALVQATQAHPGFGEPWHYVLGLLIKKLKADINAAFDRPYVAAKLDQPRSVRDVAAAPSRQEPGVVAASPTGTPAARPAAPPQDLPTRNQPGGIYALEHKITFNTLDQVAFDAASGTVTLIGHFDSRYAGPRIPYLQHLAELLENPHPAFSLDWTPESERAVDAFLRRMDEPTAMAALPSQMGEWFGPDGLPTSHGRHMLGMFGIHPIKEGRRPGYLGIDVGSYDDDLYGLSILRVHPGSPAARAGITTRDAVDVVDDQQLLHPMEYQRAVRQAGAGRTVKVWIQRSDGTIEVLEITLGEGSGDPWQGVTRPDMVALLLRNAGNHSGANIVEAIQRMHRLAHTRQSYEALSRLHFAANYARMGAQGASDAFEAYIDDYRQGRRSENDTMRVILRDVFEGIQQSTDMPYGALTSAFDDAIRRTSDNDAAYNQAIVAFNRHIEPIADRALRAGMQRTEEVVLTVSEVEDSLGTRPVVLPDFIGVDPRSQLARALFEADYLAKSLFFDPGLADRIPGYQTEYGFYADRPDIPSAVDERFWISIDSLDLARAPDGTVLAFNDVKMRFNIRDIRSGRAAAPGANDYPTLLTSLYDDFAGEFPVLHELKEAAKLAAAARWIRGIDPRFALPKGGRTDWRFPPQVDGMVHLIWSPHRSKIVMITPGGVSLDMPDPAPLGPAGPVLPVLDYPVRSDPSVVDLRDIAAGYPKIAQATWTNATLGRVLKRKIEVPIPRRLGEVARATKGERYAAALRVPPPGVVCDDGKAVALHEDLLRARAIAVRLQRVENAINLINARHVARLEAFASTARELDRAREEFVDSLYDILTQGLMDAHSTLAKRQIPTSLDELNQAASLMREGKEKLGTIRDRIDPLKLAFDAASADDIETRNRVAAELLALAKDTLSGAEVRGSGTAARGMRAALKTLNGAQRVVDVLEFGAPLVTLGSAMVRLESYDTLTERDLEALTDHLLPMQRELSDRLDAALKSPLVLDWLDGQADVVCDGMADEPPRDVLAALDTEKQGLARQRDLLMREIEGTVPARTQGTPTRTIHEGVILGLTNTPNDALLFGHTQTSPFTRRPYKQSIEEGEAMVLAFGGEVAAEEWVRGVFDNRTYGAFTLSTPTGKETIRAVQGTHFRRLIAHSNGATVAEALVRRGIITVDELNIVGGDRSLVNMAGYQQLIRSGTVKRVTVWINPGDLIPSVSSSPFSYPLRNVALYMTELLKEDRGGDVGIELRVLEGPGYAGQDIGKEAHALGDAYFPNIEKATSSEAPRS